MSQQQLVKLNQEQSAILDNLPWGPEQGRIINYQKDGEAKSFFKKYRECPYDNNTVEAQNIFASLGVQKVENFSGVYTYYAGKEAFQQEKPYRRGPKSSNTPVKVEGRVLEQYNKGSQEKEEYWNKVRERQDARDEDFKQRHEESMQMMRVLEETIRQNTEAVKENTYTTIKRIAQEASVSSGDVQEE